MNRARGTIERLWDAVERAERLPTAGVELWRCRLPLLRTVEIDEAVRLGWLTGDERAMAHRKANAELRSMFCARRLLRRMVVATRVGRSPAEVRVLSRCADCGETAHGQPYVDVSEGGPLRMSTSSAGGWSVVAIGEDSVGVDIESRIRAEDLVLERLIRVVPGWRLVAEICPSGSSPLEIWTALEALSKTTGRGLVASERELESAIDDHRLVWLTDQPGLVTCVATSIAPAEIVTFDLPFADAIDASIEGRITPSETSRSSVRK